MDGEGVDAAHSIAHRARTAAHWLWLMSACVAVMLGLGHPSQAHPQAPAAVGLQWIKQATLRDAADGSAPAQTVSLSNGWNGVNRSGNWIYQIEFSGPNTPGSWGLYIPRIGNRAQITLNGWVVGQLGSLNGDTSDFAQRPHLFHLPEAALRSGRNTVQLLVQGDRARYAGLSSLAIGPWKDTQDLYFWRDLMQTQGSFAIVVIAIIFALSSAALTVVSRERTFLLFALACFFCAVRTTYALAVDTAPLDYRVWGWIVDTSFGGYLVCLSLFCLEVIHVKRRWAMLITAVVVSTTLVLVPMHAFGRLAWARQLWTMGMVIYAMCFSAALVYHWWRTPSTTTRVLGMAGLLAVSLGLYDHVLVFYTADGFGAFTLTRYSLLLFMVAMAWVLVKHYAGQHQREITLRQSLQAELEEKTAQLVTQFHNQAKLIETMAHEKERERLVHDLHDGIGLQLNTLLYMAEGRADSRTEMLNEVRTAIDQMRLLVDNSQSFEGSFLELLGHVRHRIESRLQRVGVTLDWQIDLPDTATPVPEPKAIAFQHLMFELTTNVIKHAKATVMTVRLTPAATGLGVELWVSDNGVGFNPQSARHGGGSRSLQRRAHELGASLLPGHQGNCLHLTFCAAEEASITEGS